MQISFTEKSIARIRVNSTGKRTIYTDKNTPYLSLFVRKTKVYYYTRKYNNKPIQIPLGNANVITLEQAKDKVNEFSLDLANGKDPRVKQIENKVKIDTEKNQLIKFKDLFKLFIESNPDKSPRSIKIEHEHF